MYPPHHHGGYELACKDVVDRWRARGHDVTVLTSTMRLPDVADPPGERSSGIRRDLEISFAEGDLKDPPRWRRYPIERTNQRALQEAIAASQPDVISLWHMGAMSTGLLSTLAQGPIPLVYVVCDDWPTYAHKIDPWMRMWLKRPRLAKVVQRVGGVPASLPDIGRSGTFCFTSGSNRDRCLQFSPWSYPDWTITYLGIDHADFPVVDRPPDHEWRWRMVNAGRLDPRKGIETAIRALALLPPEATLRLLAPVADPYLETLEKVAADAGVADRVSFRISTRADLRHHYGDADVCVFPTEWDEPFGLVPLEAMACGTPVVATGSGGSGEFLIDGHNCLRFQRKDAEGLAAAVRRLADDSRLRQRLVQTGLRTAGELNVDRLAEVLHQWHLAAAEGYAQGRPPDRVLEGVSPEAGPPAGP
jgi:glycosyltransferase involved in cell wall biosynthesis